MNRLIRIFFALLCSIIFTFSSVQAEGGKVMIVLDVSGSMWGQIDGAPKIQIARSALKSMLAKWPEGEEVGLVAYGHRTKGDCKDIETVVSVGPLDKIQLGKVVDKLVPHGKTPLSAAVKHAAEELKFTENKVTVILISDGIETCNLDPCKVGADLEAYGIDFTAHVIGFDVSSLEDQKGLKCLAENTGGNFVAAANADQLNQALSQATEATTAPEPVAEHKPLPSAKITAPDSVVKGTEVIFQITGDKGAKDEYVYLYKKGKEKPLGYVRVVESNLKDGFEPGKIRLPAIVGEYQLKLQTRDKTVVAEASVRATEAEVEIIAPAEVAIGTQIDFSLTAPKGLDGYVYLYALNKDKAITYDRVVENNREGGYANGKLRAPTISGHYTLKWQTNSGEVLAETTVSVIESTVTITAPAEVIGGTEVKFSLSGPEGLNGYVYLYAAGKDKSITYDRVVNNRKAEGYIDGKIRVPNTAGSYTLKWQTNSREVLAETTFSVLEAKVGIVAEAEAAIGTEVDFSLSGPDGLDGYVYLYPAGKDKSITYQRIAAESGGGYKKGKVRLPSAAGTYDLRWINSQKQVLAETVVEAIPVDLTIDAPEEAAISTELKVSLKAPEGLNGYIYLYAAGKEKHITYGRVVEAATGGYQPLKIKLPAVVGDFELKWLTRSKEVLATHKLKIIGAEISIEAPKEINREQPIIVSLKAPAGIDGRIYLHFAGNEKFISSSLVTEGRIEDYDPIKIKGPADAGDYQLKWLNSYKELLAETSFKVVEE